MADVVISVLEASRHEGVNVTNNATALTSGNTYLIPNNGSVRLVVQNGEDANVVTVATPTDVDGNAVADLSVAVAADTIVVLGPYPTQVYNNSAGQLALTVTEAASITAIRN